jgi:hypothetical protein
MSNNPEFDFLNSVKWLYLREVSEPKDNSLRIVVEEAVANRSAQGPARTDLPKLTEILKDSWPIESTERCKAFELCWGALRRISGHRECVGSCGGYDDAAGLYQVTLP